MNQTHQRHALTALATSLLAAFGAQAQSSNTDATNSQTVVVTGTATLRAGFATPLSTTAIGASELQRVSASSQADRGERRVIAPP